MAKKPPRGIRNHNPANLDRVKGTTWKGQAEDQSSDPRFVVFSDPIWGIRALAKVLLTYRNKHRLNTVRKIIHRWAPPSENDTDAYVREVAKALRVAPDAAIDVREVAVMLPLAKAIIQHENGMQPYGEWTLRAGLALAGVSDEGGGQ